MPQVRNPSPSWPVARRLPLCPAPMFWPFLAPAQPSRLTPSGLITAVSTPSCSRSSQTPCSFFPKLVLSKISLFNFSGFFRFVSESFVSPLPQLIQVSFPGLCAPPPPPPRRQDLLRLFRPPSRSPHGSQRPAPWLSSPRLPSDFARLCYLLPFLSCACGEVEEGLGLPGEKVPSPSLILSRLVRSFVSSFPFLPLPGKLFFAPAL